jgi:hypothetical protein
MLRDLESGQPQSAHKLKVRLNPLLQADRIQKIKEVDEALDQFDVSSIWSKNTS